VVGVGPGSSPRDYALAGLRYEERWARLEECVAALRSYFRGEPIEGATYCSDERLEPLPLQRGGPPIWLGSWGAKSGLQRTALLADGWLASGYNTTPERFASSLARLGDHLRAQGKDPAGFPNAIATMWSYVTEDRAEADALLASVLAPMLRRDVAELRGKLPIGTAEECARVLRAYRDAGAQRVFLWPIADEPAQLAAFRERVVPLVESS
jgi:alkanesulfonate monooxygenase SsuD/methylene tetrahydromethanopterin reductase-like flavin-dependent oxidoreductase (luciferase family)